MLQGIRKVVQEKIAKQNSTELPSYTYDPEAQTFQQVKGRGMKKGGYVKAADGCAQRGKTRGKML